MKNKWMCEIMKWNNNKMKIMNNNNEIMMK